MPAYKNNTSTSLYVPEEVKPGETRTFSQYKYGTDLTLINENHLDLTLFSGTTTTLVSGGTSVIQVNRRAEVDLSISCLSGGIDVYFNSTSFTPLKLPTDLAYNAIINTGLIKTIYLTATAPSTIVHYNAVRVR